MIVIDVETTGIDPETSSILSIGAVELEHPEKQFYEECRVWEGAHIAKEALAVNGFTEEECIDPKKQTEAELVQRFVDWAAKVPETRTLGGQNVTFDFDMVRYACVRAHIDFPFPHRRIDIHSLVWQHLSSRGIEPPVRNGHSAISLNFALEYCGLPKEPDPHNALTGAKCHAEVISRIAYTKKLLPEFSSYPIPWTHDL